MKPLRVFCVRVGLNLYCCYLSGFFVVVFFKDFGKSPKLNQ